MGGYVADKSGFLTSFGLQNSPITIHGHVVHRHRCSRPKPDRPKIVQYVAGGVDQCFMRADAIRSHDERFRATRVCEAKAGKPHQECGTDEFCRGRPQATRKFQCGQGSAQVATMEGSERKPFMESSSLLQRPTHVGRQSCGASFQERLHHLAPLYPSWQRR